MNLYRICALVWLPLLAAACSQDSQDDCLPCRKVRTVDVQLSGVLPVSQLTTPLYLFRRPSGTQQGYVLDRTYTAVADGERLKLPLSDLKAYDYRFLMIAQPAGSEWLTLRAAAGTPFVPGAAWEDLRLESATGLASADGYCGFTDISGGQLLSDGKIRLTLTRIAGQPLFDFFRIGTSIDDPVGIVSAEVVSVLDRVSEIEIEYTGVTKSLRFDDAGQLRPAALAAEPLRQTIQPAAADFKVALPQAEKGLYVGDAALRGSARIEGLCLLPSEAELRVRMVFTYYDTTPSCGNDHPGSDHAASCYPQRQLPLDLPSATAEAGLSVAADCFTVNRAGLRCDRIIDIPFGGGLEINFDWL